MKKTGYIFCGLAVMAMMASAQDKKVRKADTKFTNYAYASAIQSYEQLVKDGYTEEEVYKNLGNANYLNANYEEASSWYGKLFALKQADIDPEYMYRYAQTLKLWKTIRNPTHGCRSSRVQKRTINVPSLLERTKTTWNRSKNALAGTNLRT